MSDRMIALTIVAFGTSLPELVTSVTAARKGNADLAVGNVVGSNIFNILMIIGTVALIRPIPFADAFYLIWEQRLSAQWFSGSEVFLRSGWNVRWEHVCFFCMLVIL